MAQRKGLGKGLDALIPTGKPAGTVSASSGEYTPPVKRYSSSFNSSRNFRPMFST